MVTLICSGHTTSRAAISRELDMSRSTVGLGVEYLLDRGILDETVRHNGARGRPHQELVIGPHAAKIGLIDFRHQGTTVAVADLSGTVLCREQLDIPLLDGAEASLGLATAALRTLTENPPSGPVTLGQVIISVSAPVNSAAGSLERFSAPREKGRGPIISWEEYPVARYAEHILGVPAQLENDANVMALAEARSTPRPGLPLIRFELSLGIGAGIIDANGQIFRGAGGVAGDLGHVGLHAVSSERCWCGKIGCFGVVGSLQSVLDHLGVWGDGNDAGRALDELRDLLRMGQGVATRRVWAAADAVGEVAATVVDLLNPATLVLGGEMTTLGSDVLARVRATIYERALALSTRHLQVINAEPRNDAIVGGARLGQMILLSADGLERQLATADER